MHFVEPIVLQWIDWNWFLVQVLSVKSVKSGLSSVLGWSCIGVPCEGESCARGVWSPMVFSSRKSDKLTPLKRGTSVLYSVICMNWTLEVWTFHFLGPGGLFFAIFFRLLKCSIYDGFHLQKKKLAPFFKSLPKAKRGTSFRKLLYEVWFVCCDFLWLLIFCMFFNVSVILLGVCICFCACSLYFPVWTPCSLHSSVILLCPAYTLYIDEIERPNHFS